MTNKKIVGIVVVVAVFVLALPIGCGSATTVHPGTRGVVVTLGNVSPVLLEEGFHFTNPLSRVHAVSIRQNTVATKADAFSSDLQHIGVHLKILYRVPQSSILDIFRNYAGDPFDSLIAPRAQEAVKEVTAILSAEQIAKAREEVKQDTLTLLRKKVGQILVIEDLIVENVSLSGELQRAIEAKMVQEQEAAKAKFVQQQAQTEAETAVIRAKGEAESIKIRGEALKQNANVVEMTLLEKWNGVAPMVVGGGSGVSIILPIDKK